jgi:integrase
VSVFKQKDRKAWTYEFVYKGKTYKGSTEQLTREDAEAFELREQQKVRRIAAGLGDLRDAPYFQEWAGIYYEYKATSKQRVRRPDQIDFLLRSVLKFWGRRPRDPKKVDAHAPYHDHTLAEPIERPELLDAFEDWMEGERFSGSHRNHLRTQVSGMYRVAMLPKYRKRTGVTMNPMDGVPRDRRRPRTVTLSPGQIVEWIRVAPYHVRLAMAIGALAPKLRVANILALEWDVHLDPGFTTITVVEHKTSDSAPPIVQMVSEQLRLILVEARRRNPGRSVVTYRGRRVHDIIGGVKAAAERAGLAYGRDRPGGATFHTIRHAMATLFARLKPSGLPLSEPQRAALMAHSDIGTTQGYTHLNPVHELEPLEALSAELPVLALVNQPWTRWHKRLLPENREEADRGHDKTGPKTP